jgi:hypothetical protein
MKFLTIKKPSIFTAFFWLLSFNSQAFLQIQLSPTTVTGGEPIQLTAQGGQSPYLWLTEAGQLQSNDGTGKQASLTAPQVAGKFSVTLIDAKGEKATSEFQVVWQKFSVSPPYIYLKPKQSVTINLHQVTDEVKILADAGTWEWLPKANGTNIRYTAPETPGFYALTFYQTNAPLDTRLVHVKVYQPLEITTSSTAPEPPPSPCTQSMTPPSVFLEEHERVYLTVHNGVPPYLWIEGGRGSIEYIGTDRSRVRYLPGTVIGQETVSVYDSAGSSIDIHLMVKGLFRISPVNHSVCLDNPIVTFHASGGECPYQLSPPTDQNGYQVIELTKDSLTLKFKREGVFNVVASDAAVKTAIAKVTVNPTPCHCKECLPLEPAGPIYHCITESHPPPTNITVLVKESIGSVDWLCQGSCDLNDLNVTTGKEVTFYPRREGYYELIAHDSSARTGVLAIYLGSDLNSLYSGADNQLAKVEVQRILDDFFTPDFCYQRSDFYWVLDKFLSNL